MLLFLGIPRKGPKKPADDVQGDFRHLIATDEALTPDASKRDLADKVQANVVDDEPEILDWDVPELLARKK